MAVDTKEKRLSVIAMDAAGTGIHTIPDPTGSFNLGDRQHLLDCYSGIDFAAPGGAVLASQLRMAFQMVAARVFSRVN
jgi:hypothetical protein